MTFAEEYPVNLDALIPKHKDDLRASRRARAAGYPAIQPIHGELLSWMRDMNWPVASEIETVLQTVGAPLSPHILNVLQGGDDIWKYWVLTRLAANFDREAQASIMDECLRIVNKPTDGEIAEEVNLAAREILILDAQG